LAITSRPSPVRGRWSGPRWRAFGFAPGLVWIQNIFWPLTRTPGKEFQGYLDIALMLIFMLGVVIVVAGAARRCLSTLRGEAIPREAAGPPVVADAPPMGCC
jgi:hypothetical protein